MIRRVFLYNVEVRLKISTGETYNVNTKVLAESAGQALKYAEGYFMHTKIKHPWIFDTVVGVSLIESDSVLIDSSQLEIPDTLYLDEVTE